MRNVISLISYPSTCYSQLETLIWSEEKMFYKTKKYFFFIFQTLKDPASLLSFWIEDIYVSCLMKIEKHKKPYQISNVVNELMRPQKNLGPNFFQFPCVCPNSLLPKLKPRFNESCRKEDGRISCSTFQVNEWYFLSADIKGHPSKMCLNQQRNYLLYKTKYPAKCCRFVKTIARSFWEYRFYFAMMCEKSQGG